MNPDKGAPEGLDWRRSLAEGSVAEKNSHRALLSVAQWRRGVSTNHLGNIQSTFQIVETLLTCGL